MLGNAGGTVTRAYGRFFPGTSIDGVEIDPDVSEVGRRFFGLDENPRLRTFDEDARPFLRRTERRYDVIGVDAYRQPYIPFYLTTREFFTLVRDRLTPGGAMVVNVGHPPGQDALEKAISSSAGAAFRHVRRVPLLRSTTLVVASDREPTPARLRRAAAGLPAELRELAGTSADLLAPALRGGAVYTDDRAPVEWLVDASILRFAAKGEEP